MTDELALKILAEIAATGSGHLFSRREATRSAIALIEAARSAIALIDQQAARIAALEAKCALLAASLAQSEREVEEREERIAVLAPVAPAVDAQPVAQRAHKFAIIRDRNYDGEGRLSLWTWDGGYYVGADGDCLSPDPDGTLDGYTAEWLTDYQLEARLNDASAQSDGLRVDAGRYRFARDNITEGYRLPGGFYLSDCADGCWDKTIDAAMSQHTGEKDD